MTTLWAAEAGLYVGIDNRGNIVTSVSSHSTLAKFIYLVKKQQKTNHITCENVIAQINSANRPQHESPGEQLQSLWGLFRRALTEVYCLHKNVITTMLLITSQAAKIPACILRENLDMEFFNSFCKEFSPRRLHCLSISAQGKVRSSILTSSRNVQFITKRMH